MSKDIRYFTKRRVNQLITSQTVQTLECKNYDGIGDINKTSVGYVSNKNEITDASTNSLEISDDLNVNFNKHIVNTESNITLNNHIDKEIACNDLNDLNVHMNINVPICKELPTQKRTLINDLRSWTIQQNISHTALNSLIEIFRFHGHKLELPCDARTLMQTPKRATQSILNINNGFYFHFGVKNGIKQLLTKYFETCPQKIKIQINCDGRYQKVLILSFGLF